MLYFKNEKKSFFLNSVMKLLQNAVVLHEIFIRISGLSFLRVGGEWGLRYMEGMGKLV